MKRISLLTHSCSTYFFLHNNKLERMKNVKQNWTARFEEEGLLANLLEDPLSEEADNLFEPEPPMQYTAAYMWGQTPTEKVVQV